MSTILAQKEVFGIFYVAGSCGSFLSTVVEFYIRKKKNQSYKNLGQINYETGDCHFLNSCSKFHFKDDIPPGTKIIAIDFDDNDKEYIFKMSFHKEMKFRLNQDHLQDNWNGKYQNIPVSNLGALEITMSKNLDDHIFPNWKQLLKEVNPVLIVNFKDIMFGNLNKIIADFFETDLLPEAEIFINQYRKINNKYFFE